MLFRSTTYDVGNGLPWSLVYKGNTPAPTRNWLNQYFSQNDGRIFTGIRANNNIYNIVTTTATWTANTWYHLALVYDGTNLTIYVNGIGENTIAMGDNVGAGTDTDWYFGTNAWGVGTEFSDIIMDELAISDVNRFANPWTFPESNTAPDLNVSKINGFDLNVTLPYFSFIDGNLTITLSVFDAENNRLTADINYSEVNTQGTGTPIYTDLNLTSEHCADLDWNDSPSDCNISWDISNVSDSNYFIIAELFDGTNIFFNSSDNNFGIDNNAPNVINWYPTNDFNARVKPFTFWVQITDAGIGAKGAWFGHYRNEILDSNGFADVNSDGFAKTTVLMNANLDQSFLIWYAFSDLLDNNWTKVITSAIYTYIIPEGIEQNPTIRYYAQDDERTSDVTRFFSDDDLRKDDSTRYLSSNDSRAGLISGLSGYRFGLESGIDQKTIELYLTIGTIIIALILIVGEIGRAHV